MFKFRRQCGEKTLKEQEIWTFDIDDEKKFKRLLSNPLRKGSFIFISRMLFFEDVEVHMAMWIKNCGKNRGISCK